MEPRQHPFDFILYGQPSTRWTHQQLAAACRTVLDIEGRLAAPLDDEAVAGMIADGVVERCGSRVGFGPKMAFFPRSLVRPLACIARRFAEVYAEEIGAARDRLPAMCAALRPLCAGTAGWDDVAYPVLAGMIVDLGIRRQLLEHALLLEQPDDYWIWAFEGDREVSRHAFGVQMWSAPGGEAALAQLWHARTRRPAPLKVDPADVALMHSLFVHDAKPEPAPANIQARLLKLTYYRLLRKHRGAYEVTVPVLNGASGEELCAKVRDVAEAICVRGVEPALAATEDVFQANGIAVPTARHRNGFVRMLMEAALGAVVEGGLLPEPPVTADPRWATWMTVGPSTKALFSNLV